jgi:hypothetical protein
MRKFLLFLCLCLPLVAADSSPIDFSHAGYAGGGVPIPEVSAKFHVEPTGGDDTLAIQGALDAVAALPPDATGFRGAVLLRPGKYKVNGSLHFRASGTVLRGQGATLIATGSSRRTVIRVHGDPAHRTLSAATNVTGDVPAGARTLNLESVGNLKVGAQVVVRRPSTKEWIQAIAMDQFTGSFKDARLDWWPGSRDLEWVRTVTDVDEAAKKVTFDAPLTMALETRYGGATVQEVTWATRLRNVGIENLSCESEYDSTRPSDEEHAWICISLDDVEDAWVRDVSVKHFVSAAVWIGAGARRTTVQDVTCESPIAENGGWRRHAFYTRGQQGLFLRCVARDAREAFVAGLCSAGPNVFLECTATRALADSGSFESWATGALFDLVTIDGAGIALGNLGERWQGAGWNAANSVVWNCRADSLRVESPPTAQNSLHPSPATATAADPRAPVGSLYRDQLIRRLGKPAAEAALMKKAPASAQTAGETRAAPPAAAPAPLPSKRFKIEKGQFTFDGFPLFAGGSSNAWWKGQTVPARAASLGFHPMRWAPGLEGPGLTENLPQLVRSLAQKEARLVHLWPGLWYDRRRDDHRTVTRENAEVWAPFYELPWARSGQGTAVDGLSKFDLEKFNPWYFERLREFTRLAAAEGVVVYHHLYNHHNLVEAAAHWAEFPWRSANCLQDTGFAEPPAYENGGKRVGIVAEFYDVSHPVRRDLHRRYIRHCLDQLQEFDNVIHTVAFQFAGPQSFQDFFLDVVAEWQKERSRKLNIALNTSKTITDTVMADPARRGLVNVVDQRYWQYLPDGTLFAPHSDGKLAFREQRAQAFGKDAVPAGTPELVYRQVREYSEKYPDVAVLANHAGQGPIPILMARGAYPLIGDFAAAQPLKTERDDRALFAFLRDRVGRAKLDLQPVVGMPPGSWALAAAGKWLVYSSTGDAVERPKPLTGKSFEGWWFNPRTGETLPLTPSTEALLKKPSEGAWLVWLQEKPSA